MMNTINLERDNNILTTDWEGIVLNEIKNKFSETQKSDENYGDMKEVEILKENEILIGNEIEANVLYTQQINNNIVLCKKKSDYSSETHIQEYCSEKDGYKNNNAPETFKSANGKKEIKANKEKENNKLDTMGDVIEIKDWTNNKLVIKNSNKSYDMNNQICIRTEIYNIEEEEGENIKTKFMK
ncbi:conserved Plasmodium protein, unknown function [Plasmodium malariae]|uniref:Uncharacterized protein n=1 Tax=Plasmodium malariae TaxID=5858 RepID=A0A1C3L1G2_PLAMA|nr:conserved Plasmodium protein, unknown function [Plasmodium malariae]